MDAQSRLENINRIAFQDECDRTGKDRNLGSCYYRPAFDYSRARLAVKTWPARKAELAAKYIAARRARIEVETESFAAGSVRACTVASDGTRGRPVVLVASVIPSQLQKASNAGMAVEILESSNPQFPVGRPMLPPVQTGALCA